MEANRLSMGTVHAGDALRANRCDVVRQGLAGHWRPALHLLAALLLTTLLAACAGTSAPRVSDVEPQYVPPPEAIVLRVRVREVEPTGHFPGNCRLGVDCIPFYFWHRYRAEVKAVVQGSWTGREVRFVHLQHAEYVDRVTRDCYVVLLPADTELKETLDVPFVADRLFSRVFEHDREAIRGLAQRP